MKFDGKHIGGMETGPVRFGFRGDEKLGQEYVPIARQFVGDLKRRMQLSLIEDNPVYQQEDFTTLPDGTVIYANSIFGGEGAADIDDVIIDTRKTVKKPKKPKRSLGYIVTTFTEFVAEEVIRASSIRIELPSEDTIGYKDEVSYVPDELIFTQALDFPDEGSKIFNALNQSDDKPSPYDWVYNHTYANLVTFEFKGPIVSVANPSVLPPPDPPLPVSGHIEISIDGGPNTQFGNPITSVSKKHFEQIDCLPTLVAGSNFAAEQTYNAIIPRTLDYDNNQYRYIGLRFNFEGVGVQPGQIIYKRHDDHGIYVPGSYEFKKDYIELKQASEKYGVSTLFMIGSNFKYKWEDVVLNENTRNEIIDTNIQSDVGVSNGLWTYNGTTFPLGVSHAIIVYDDPTIHPDYGYTSVVDYDNVIVTSREYETTSDIFKLKCKCQEGVHKIKAVGTSKQTVHKVKIKIFTTDGIYDFLVKTEKHNASFETNEIRVLIGEFTDIFELVSISEEESKDA